MGGGGKSAGGAERMGGGGVRGHQLVEDGVEHEQLARCVLVEDGRRHDWKRGPQQIVHHQVELGVRGRWGVQPDQCMSAR